MGMISEIVRENDRAFIERVIKRKIRFLRGRIYSRERVIEILKGINEEIQRDMR